MSRGNWSRYIVAAGVLVSGATITVEKESGGYAVLFDKDGGSKSNPFTTGADGLAQFFADAEADGFKVTINDGTDTQVLRNQPLGSAQFYDVGSDSGSKLLTRDQLDARYYAIVQDNTTATADPTVDDDSGAGYGIGSRWYNTSTSEVFLCLDPAAGAAIWVKTSLTLDELGSLATLNSGTGAGDVRTNSQNEALFALQNASVEQDAGTARTLSEADSDLVQFTGSSAIAITLPATTTEAIPTGVIRFYEKAGTGDLTFSPEAGATMNAEGGKTVLSTQYKTACVIVTAAQTFLVVGLES